MDGIEWRWEGEREGRLRAGMVGRRKGNGGTGQDGAGRGWVVKLSFNFSKNLGRAG